MNAYFFKMTNEEKDNILDQHKTIYDGYVTSYAQQPKEQPLYTQDFANDKEGITVSNKGVVTAYKNMGINEMRFDNKSTGLFADEENAFKEPMEGYCEQVPQQIEDLLNLLNEIKPLKILEIGFNAGHSSELFLKNSKATVVSFDLGYHSYVYYAKKYIDSIYPDRHTLILGDSNITIKQFNEETFDIIFIDGGHDYECAKNDIINCNINGLLGL